MAERPSLLYFLFSKNKRALYLDEDNFIQESNADWKRKDDGRPAHLVNSPEGWKETTVKLVRNIKYWGLFRDIALPMKFTGDGAKILKTLKFQAGVKAICYLGILKLNREKEGYDYEAYHLTDINFARWKQNLTGCTVEALEGGPSKYLKAYENTKYDIGIDSDPEKVTVYHDGMELGNTATFFVGNGNSSRSDFEFGNHVAEVQLVQKEIDRIGGAYSVTRQKVTDGTQLKASDRYIFVATTAGTIKFEWDFTLSVNVFPPNSINPAAILKTAIARVRSGQNAIDGEIVLLSRTVADGIVGNYNLAGSGEIDVNPGDSLYLWTFYSPIGNPPQGDKAIRFVYGGAEPMLKMTYTYRHPASKIEALTPFTLGKRLVEKMSSKQYGLKSNFLNQLGAEFVFASGDSIRKIEGAEIKTTFEDYFKTLKARWSVGLGIEGDYFVIEKLDYFFGKDVVDIGEIKDPELVDAEDLMFNTIKAGYENQDYEAVNGKLEFNQEQNWSTVVDRYTNELDLTSKYRSDSFGIEVIRINLEGKTTTDNEGDNDTFILSVKKTEEKKYILDRPAYSNVGGLLYPESAFNLKLSPKIGLLNNGSYIRSVMDLLDNTEITLTASERNSELSRTLNGVTITENSPIQIGSLNERLFRPYYFNFTTKISENTIAFLKAKPYSKIKFTCQSIPYYGYVVDASVRIADRDKQTWKLLCAPETDLTKF